MAVSSPLNLGFLGSLPASKWPVAGSKRLRPPSSTANQSEPSGSSQMPLTVFLERELGLFFSSKKLTKRCPSEQGKAALATEPVVAVAVLEGSMHPVVGKALLGGEAGEAGGKLLSAQLTAAKGQGQPAY